jgi:hypothetical protein
MQMRDYPTATTTTDILLHDSHMTVSLIKTKPSPRLADKLQPIKCYRDEPENGKHSFHEAVLPIIVIEPHAKYHDGELYDYNAQIHLSHGVNMSDEINGPITGLEFRRRRPDLEHFFKIERLAPVFASAPVLGFHFNLSDIETAHDMVMGLFRRLVENDFTDQTIVTILSYKLYYDHTAVEDQHVNSGRATVLPMVFRDEISQHIGMIVTELTTAMTLEVQEHRHQRSRLIAKVVNKWLDASSTKRIAQRMMGRPEQYMFLLSFVLTAFLEDKLEQAIYEVIKTT